MIVDQLISSIDKQASELGCLTQSQDGIQPAALVPPVQSSLEKPAVLLPGGSRSVIDTALELGPLIGRSQRVFNRGGALVRVRMDPEGHFELVPLQHAALVSEFERVASLQKLRAQRGSDQMVAVPIVGTEQEAKLIAHSAEFLDSLPVLNVLSRCPVLVCNKDGTLREVHGYDVGSGILAGGGPTQVISLEDAVKTINNVLADFHFATPGDHARALAALITPALVPGLLLGGRAPIDLGEADEPQAGKGFRARLTAAVYGCKLTNVTERKGGVGSLEESFNRALLSGAGFINIDNARGKIDSPAFESFMTEDSYLARALRTDAFVDPRRTVVMLTSNKAELTTDLAKRSASVRIRKMPKGYEFKKYAEGDLLDHIKENQPLYLGAVFAVVRAWHAAGCPQTNETRHDFRAWARRLDWIVQNIFGTCPLLDGHQQAQTRMANPMLTWLRDLANAVKRQGRCHRGLRTNDLVGIAEVDGNIQIPGLKEGQEMTSDSIRTSVLQAFGKRLKQCFGDEFEVTLDDMGVSRRGSEEQRTGLGGGSYTAWTYSFRPVTTKAPILIHTDPRTDQVAHPTDAVDNSGEAVFNKTFIPNI